MSIMLNYFLLEQKTENINCDLFRAASLDTWKRIGFSRTKPKLKIHETTITQNLVYEFHLLKQYFPSIVRIYESKDESANGDDLEIAIRNNNTGHYIKFALQAKILYHNLPQRNANVMRLSDGRYKQFQHAVGNPKVNQVDLLLTYARNNGAIPLYLLYNYVFGYFPPKTLCGIDFDITQYGCSIVHAQFLKNRFSLSNGNLIPNVKFTNLHPSIALPWFVIPCCFANLSLNKIFDNLHVDKPDYNIRSFSEEELIDEFLWKSLEVIPEIKGKAITEEVQRYSILKENEQPVFNPKFKMIID
ncbi:MAG: hypothetical protein QM725_12015 [Lacibacter sp.]